MMNALAETIGGTPYESQRARLRKMVRAQADRSGQRVSVARASVARQLRLTPDRVINIEKGKLKGLYDDIRDRIDDAFVAMAQRQIVDLADEMAMAAARGRRGDARLLAQAEAARDALEQLIAERAGGGAQPEEP